MIKEWRTYYVKGDKLADQNESCEGIRLPINTSGREGMRKG